MEMGVEIVIVPANITHWFLNLIDEKRERCMIVSRSLL